jgi:hypothetical protein
VGKKAIVAGVVGLLFLVVISLMFFVVRATAPAVTVRYIKTVQSGNSLAMTLQISNHTANGFIFHPFKLEAREGDGWKTRCKFEATSFRPAPELTAYSLTNFTFEVTNAPAGSSLRFTIRVQEVLTGAKGFIRRVEVRHQDTISGSGGKPFPLNPYDKWSKVFGKPIEVVTEEFVLPEPK